MLTCVAASLAISAIRRAPSKSFGRNRVTVPAQEAEGAVRDVKWICIEIAAIAASGLHNPASGALLMDVVPATPAPRPALVPRDDRPFRSEPRQPDNAEKPRRIMVSMTQEELERLDIAAIKKGASRHDIVRSALSDYFRKLSAEFPRPCPCMEGGPAVPARHPEMMAAHPSYPVRVEDLDSAILAMQAAENRS